ncbi:MAG: serine protease [Elusimicrobiaceae bacterium]|nr:serine protease [Elusimicrobiaceae bacterium]
MQKNKWVLKISVLIVGILLAMPALAQRSLAQASGRVMSLSTRVSAGGGFSRFTESVSRAMPKEWLYQHRSPMPENMGPMDNSTFQVRGNNPNNLQIMTGTVFQLSRNGQKEIFGVIAAHAIEDAPVGRFFTAEAYLDGKFIPLRAEIVQVTPTATLDLALVSLRGAESLFEPLDLATRPVQLGETLQTQGFARYKVAFLPGRHVIDNTLFSLRTDMLYSRRERPGLCGSPVFRTLPGPEGAAPTYELLGIHTGSTHGAMIQEDVGYATHAQFLPTLVEAYYNNGQATYPLVLGERTLTELNVDEFVSLLTLKDESGRELWQRSVADSKFPYRTLEKAIQDHPARYLELSISRVVLNGDHLVESQKTLRQVVYDLQENKQVERP